jgi:putative methyltransferase (TIGR04325 family)
MSALSRFTHYAKKLFNASKSFLKTPAFSGNFKTWQEASRHTSGYNTETILNKVVEASLKVRNGAAAYERDSVVFHEIEYSWPVLSAILWIASQNGNRLNIVDFGGSFGSSYYQNISFLSHLTELRWNIVEQTAFVERGKKDFENEHLKFYSDLQECHRSEHPQAILCSSVIHYLERPYEFMDSINDLRFRYIIIDRMPFLIRGEDKVVVQKVPPAIYEATIPCWLLNLDKFKSYLLRAYELIAEFEGFEKSVEENMTFKGFILRRRN